MSARYYKHRGECLRKQKPHRVPTLRRHDWDLHDLDFSNLPSWEPPDRPDSIASDRLRPQRAPHVDFELETSDNGASFEVLNESAALQRKVIAACGHQSSPLPVSARRASGEGALPSPRPRRERLRLAGEVSTGSRPPKEKYNGRDDLADRPSQKGVSLSKPAREECIIIPQAPVESQTFGYGVPAVTKEIPPCAKAMTLNEAPDLTPEERFQSTYTSTFAHASRKNELFTVGGHPPPERPTGLPMRYIPAECRYSRDQAVGWHVRRGFAPCARAD